MLLLTFQLGEDRYAIEAARITEIVPLVNLKQLPQAPRGVAGLINYRGRPVPVVDLSELAFGHPSARRLSTRIILTHYEGSQGRKHPVGLIAERATEMINRDARQFVESGVQVGAAPYLGPVLVDGTEVIQLIQEQGLISEPIRDALASAGNSSVA